MINSDLVQWFIRFAFSKSGVAVRWIVGLLIGWVAGKNIVPSGDLAQIQISLTSGLTAVFAIGYAGVQYWINARQQKAIKVVQTMVGTETTGVVGNNTVRAVSDVTGIKPHVALAHID